MESDDVRLILPKKRKNLFQLQDPSVGTFQRLEDHLDVNQTPTDISNPDPASSQPSSTPDPLTLAKPSDPAFSEMPTSVPGTFPSFLESYLGKTLYRPMPTSLKDKSNLFVFNGPLYFSFANTSFELQSGNRKKMKSRTQKDPISPFIPAQNNPVSDLARVDSLSYEPREPSFEHVPSLDDLPVDVVPHERIPLTSPLNGSNLEPSISSSIDDMANGTNDNSRKDTDEKQDVDVIRVKSDDKAFDARIQLAEFFKSRERLLFSSSLSDNWSSNLVDSSSPINWFASKRFFNLINGFLRLAEEIKEQINAIGWASW